MTEIDNSTVLASALTTRLRSRWIIVFAALLAVGLFTINTPGAAARFSIDAETGTSAFDGAALPTNCTYAGARVLGWVWADASYNDEGDWFFFRTTSAPIRDHMTKNLDRLGLGYATGTSAQGHDTFRITIPGYDGSFFEANPNDDRNILCDRDAFLASVIETEGQLNGKVVDDPSPTRRASMVELLNALDVSSKVIGQGVIADADDWEVFQNLPLVTCGRVPGGVANCVRGRTEMGDVNCDGEVTVSDAIVIAQFTVGARSDSAGCPLSSSRPEIHASRSDVTANGATSITDVILVTQCVVGITSGDACSG